MNKLLEVLDELIEAYERSTPEIDQNLIDRVLSAREAAIKSHMTLKRSFVGVVRGLGFGLLMAVLAFPVHAYDRSLNPDKYPSVGLDVSNGKLAGILKDTAAGAPHTDGGFVKGLLDVRVPITNALTIHAFGSSTGVNNNMQFSEGSEVGVGLRIFIQ